MKFVRRFSGFAVYYPLAVEPVDPNPAGGVNCDLPRAFGGKLARCGNRDVGVRKA